MKQIEVEIKGMTPLLMNSAENMTSSSTTKNPAKQYNAEEDAEKVAYKNKERELIVPARCLKASIINGSSWFKFGKKSAKPIIAGCVNISPYELTILDNKGKSIKKYEIDKRPVVVQRARIMRARPIIDEWNLKFTINYNDELISDSNILMRILEEAGQRIGLLDNRPQRYGENGTYKITKFLPIK